MSVKALIICGFGFNSDVELAKAFELSGARAERVHITDLVRDPAMIHGFSIMAFPGGFSFGDHLGSGKEVANILRSRVKVELEAFIKAGKPVIGICNGFQVITKLGLVPNLDSNWNPSVSLIHNSGGAFIDRWAKLDFEPGSKCVWTRGLEGSIELPIRHGEGRFVCDSEATLKRVEEGGMVALRYAQPEGVKTGFPNGSTNDIAGICDPSGLVFGLMPHPECFLIPENHPRWQRERVTRLGLEIIKRGVEHAGASA